MMTFQPKDVIAVLVIIFAFGLKLAGANGSIDAALALILGYYFVKRESKIDNGK